MKASSQEKKTRRKCLYQLRQTKSLLLHKIKKQLSGNRELVAISLVKSISHSLDKILAHLELGNTDDARLYFRVLFESNCTYNYLMLKEDNELAYYQNYSRLVAYKDLVLMIHYGLLSLDTPSDDRSTVLGQTLQQVKQELLETDVLARVGRDQNALEPENIGRLADIKYAF